MAHEKPTYGYFLALCIITTVFFSTVYLEQRNYQDLWILEGIVVPTVIFIFSFLVAEVFVQGNKKVAILAASFLAAMNLIPGLKYQLFCGVFDAPAHFRYTDQIVSLGYLPENERISEQYSGNPAMHIFMASVSIVSGISVNDVFRFIIPALSGLVPLIVYFLTKDVLDNTAQRYVVIASGFPIIMRYVAYGTSLAVLPYFLLMAVFIRTVCTRTKRRTFWFIFAILAFSVIISHAITSLFVCFVFVGLLIILKSLEIARNRYLGMVQVSALVAPCLFYVVLFFGWWANTSNFNLDRLAHLIQQLLTGATTKTPVPARFYEISVLSKLQILVVRHSRDAIVCVLSLIGSLVFLKRLKRNEMSGKTKTLYMFLLVLLSSFVLFLLFEFASGFGSVEYYRFIVYAVPLCVLLVGLALWRLSEFLHSISARPRIMNLAFTSLLFVIVSASLIQFYNYQPLVPRSKVLSEDLPEDEYIFYFGIVNTVYQVELISFAETHFHNGSITSDDVTGYQIRGFSSPSFFSRRVRHSPLEPDLDLEWDLLLLHTVKAGHLSEKAEYRTRERIENIRLEAGNIIYDNGESFIISHSLPEP